MDAVHHNKAIKMLTLVEEKATRENIEKVASTVFTSDYWPINGLSLHDVRRTRGWKKKKKVARAPHLYSVYSARARYFFACKVAWINSERESRAWNLHKSSRRAAVCARKRTRICMQAEITLPFSKKRRVNGVKSKKVKSSVEMRVSMQNVKILWLLLSLSFPLIQRLLL